MLLSHHFFNNQSFNKNHQHFSIMELMEKANLIANQGSGIYTILSLGLCLEEKLIHLIDKHMKRIHFSKIRMNILQDATLWKETGRIETYGDELFQIHNRKNTHFVLAATGEENITHLIKKFYTTQHLNVNVYQIGNKYRDELRVRGGLLRSKEFLMKDGYSFSYDQTWIDQTYDAVRSAYSALFEELGLTYQIVSSDTGEIGGDSSEEFVVSVDGEDIEVAHIFKLGTKYSQTFELSNHQKEHAICACYGIGVTRLMTVLCALQRNQQGFYGTRSFNTYDYIITVLDNESMCDGLRWAEILEQQGYSILIDDRYHLSNGKQLVDSEMILIHNRIICSRQARIRNSWEHKNIQTGELTYISY